MAVFRVHKTENYTVMSNEHLRDKRLTLKAIGLLSKMLSLPDDWDYSVKGLISICREDETAIKAALKELRKAGYVKVTKSRGPKGTYIYQYDIYESPSLSSPGVENPAVENPPVDNPAVEHPAVENPVQLNTNIPITKESNTKKQKAGDENQRTIKEIIADMPEELQPALKAFARMRGTTGPAKLTPDALELNIKKAKKLANDDTQTVIAIFEQSVANGWRGVFPLKDDIKGSNSNVSFMDL